jgi:Ca-activated chloride channel homolog
MLRLRYWQVLGLLVLGFCLAVLAGCNALRSGETMTVLAGSELKDIEPLLDEIERNTGVRLQMEYSGTLNGVEALLDGADYDLAWFSHAKYLDLLQSGRNIVVTQEKTMLSPVVLGVKESIAAAFGWLDNPNVTWKDIADRASAGELRFAMTNPAASNSGFTALVGVATALTGSGDALQAEAIDAQALQAFFKGQALTAGSSGWLAESYVREQDRLDGMINYESVLLGLNESQQLDEPLALIYPQEGIITADYPLMLLDGAKREAYDRLVSFIRSPEFQEKVMETTLRRPVTPGVPLDRRIPDSLLVELPFPNTAEVIDALLFSYLDEQRLPSHTFFVLDVSGSMEGEGLRDLKAALTNLTGLDPSLTGQFARFRSRERVTMLPFSSEVGDVRSFTVDATAAAGQDMERIRGFVDQLRAGGNTAIYSALADAYGLAQQAQAQDPDRAYSIVLMSDGQNNSGISPQDFRSAFQGLPPRTQQVKTFTVLFGDADRKEMEQIAELTGGRMFDATSESLSQIFKEIRGYQ